MDNDPNAFISLRWRLVIVAPFLAGFIKLFFFTPGEGSFTDALILLLSMVCLIVSALILGRPLVQLIANPFGWLFYPTRTIDREPPFNDVSEPVPGADKYEAAMTKLEELAKNYPEELRPHEEMIRIAMISLQDPERTEQIYRRSLETLKRQENRDNLAQFYRDLKKAQDQN